MSKHIDRILVIGFVAILIALPIVFFLLPVQTFSDMENRYLQAAPKLTWKNIWSKRFANDTETFISDQFPLRNEWVAVKSIVEQLRLQQENNGIYKGKAGYLFEKFVAPDETQVQKYTEAIRKLALGGSDADIIFMLAPTSVGVYPERLPDFAPNDAQRGLHQWIGAAVADHVTFIDGFDFLSAHATEEIYYRTDHHWTTNGAYYAYVAYAEAMGWQPLAKDAFDIVAVSDSFLGSFHTKSQFHGVAPDTMVVYSPKDFIPTEMTVVDTNETFTSLYDEHYLDTKDQYSYFLGGVHALMEIRSVLESQAIMQDKLLILKDSYAHNVIPFLTAHVPKIHVIDVRYYNGSIREYIHANGIEDVLLLFNTATFVDNAALLKLAY